MIVVEEIENGLDPRGIHLIVEEIRNAVLDGVTSRSPATHYRLHLLHLLPRLDPSGFGGARPARPNPFPAARQPRGAHEITAAFLPPAKLDINLRP
ncbi:MAG: hypothetical protein U5O69_07750 [Candidatus Competibacteraceae bacterium]|nr:hypothetical protein [Candidatus Competibacteraceae bacterium]